MRINSRNEDCSPNRADGEVSNSERKGNTSLSQQEREIDISSGGVVRSVIRSAVERFGRGTKGLKIPRVKEIRVPKPRVVAHSAEHLKEILEFNESYHHTVGHSHKEHDRGHACAENGSSSRSGADKRNVTVTPSATSSAPSAPSISNSKPAGVARAVGVGTAAGISGAVIAGFKASTLKLSHYLQLGWQIGPAFLKTSLLCTVLYSTYENVHGLRRITTFEPFSESSDQHFLVHTSLSDATVWAAACGVAAGAATSLTSISWDIIAKSYFFVKQNVSRTWQSYGTSAGVAQQHHAALRSTVISGSLVYHSTISCLLFAIYEPVKTLMMQSTVYQGAVDFSYSRLQATLHPSTSANKHHVNLHRAAHFVADFGCILTAGSIAGVLSDVVGYYLAPLEHVRLWGSRTTAFQYKPVAHSFNMPPLTGKQEAFVRSASLDPLKPFRVQRIGATANTSPLIDAVAPSSVNASTASSSATSIRELIRSMRSMPAPSISSILLTSVPHCVAFFAYEYGKSQVAGGHH